jgi:hypothetical protein
MSNQSNDWEISTARRKLAEARAKLSTFEGQKHGLPNLVTDALDKEISYQEGLLRSYNVDPDSPQQS